MRLLIPTLCLCVLFYIPAMGDISDETEGARKTNPLHASMQPWLENYHNPYLTLEEVLRSLAGYGDIARLAHYFTQEKNTLNGLREQMDGRSLSEAFLKSVRERDYVPIFTLLLLGGTTVPETAAAEDHKFVVHARFFVRECLKHLKL